MVSGIVLSWIDEMYNIYMSKDEIRLESFLKSKGEMPKLSKYKIQLMKLTSGLYETNDDKENEYLVELGLGGHWVGVAIGMLADIPISMMTLERKQNDSRRMLVGMTYVDGDYRNRGLWKAMSAKIEEIARNEGSPTLSRYVSYDVEFLLLSLSSMGYVNDVNDDWQTAMIKYL